MGQKHIGHRLDFRHFQHSEVGLPLRESIQGIVVGAEIVRPGLPSNRSIEHLAQGRTINDATPNSKTNNATRELIHHDENPIGSQRCGFTSEQIATPQTVLHVTKQGEPQRGASRIRFRRVMNAQDTANNIFVDFNAESQPDLLGNAGTAPVRITPFQFNDCLDEFFIRSFFIRLIPARGGRRTIGFLQDPLRVLSGEVRRLALATNSGSGCDADAGAAPALAGAALRSGSLREPSLRSAPAKPRRKNTTKRTHVCLLLSRPAH